MVTRSHTVTMGAMTRRTLLGLLLLAGAAACYVAVVVARQGPPPGGDTTPLTEVTSAVASGQLHGAASNDGLPNPPGYPLLASPFVAGLPSLVGSPSWCLTPNRVAARPPPHESSDAAQPRMTPPTSDECGSGPHLANPTGTGRRVSWACWAGWSWRAVAGRCCVRPTRTRLAAPLPFSCSSPSCLRRAAPSSSSTIPRTS